MFYVEWAPTVYRRRGFMVPVTALATICKGYDSGFRSVYMFNKWAADQIKAQKHSRDMDRFSVYSEALYIDLDNGAETLPKLEAYLTARGIAYIVLESGGKGYEVRVKIKPMWGPHVPHSQEIFVKELDVAADTSLYRHGSLISLPGRVHATTKKRKKEIKRVSGVALEIPYVAPPTEMKFEAAGFNVSELSNGLFRTLTMLEAEPPPGNRHNTLWSVALNFADSGLSYDCTLELLNKVNEQWKNPKAEDEVERAVREAYGKMNRDGP